MADLTADSRVLVSHDWTGPYIRLPFSQLDEVKHVLDSHSIRYRVKDNAIALSGGPLMVVLYLEGEADVNLVQKLLERSR